MSKLQEKKKQLAELEKELKDKEAFLATGISAAPWEEEYEIHCLMDNIDNLKKEINSLNKKS